MRGHAHTEGKYTQNNILTELPTHEVIYTNLLCSILITTKGSHLFVNHCLQLGGGNLVFFSTSSTTFFFGLVTKTASFNIPQKFMLIK